jgi:predicted dehydrogenase
LPPSPLRIGLIGCGRLAERGYVPAFERAEGVELAAVADPVAERCAGAAPAVPAFTSAAELLAAGAADALVLATPAEAHLPDAREAAAAGVPTLIEKPPAASLADALELARLEPAVSFGFNRRFEPRLRRLREIVPADAHIELRLEMRTRPGSWRSYVADDHVLLDLGPHLIDLARWLSGAEVDRVRATLDGSNALVELGLAGARGRARVTCADGPYRERVHVETGGRPLGRYVTGGPLAALRQLLSGSRRTHPLVPSLARQLEAFARRARGESEPDVAGPADGVAVMAVVEAAWASAEAGGAWRPTEPR